MLARSFRQRRFRRSCGAAWRVGGKSRSGRVEIQTAPLLRGRQAGSFLIGTDSQQIRCQRTRPQAGVHRFSDLPTVSKAPGLPGRRYGKVGNWRRCRHSGVHIQSHRRFELIGTTNSARNMYWACAGHMNLRCVEQVRRSGVYLPGSHVRLPRRNRCIYFGNAVFMRHGRGHALEERPSARQSCRARRSGKMSMPAYSPSSPRQTWWQWSTTGRPRRWLA